ncbi:MAG: transaldolase family protein [Candidatus Saliniplasma sp.]
MDIFVDTAKLEEIKKAESWGILDGVTTNPSLIKKAVEEQEDNKSLEDHITEILKTVNGPVSLEVCGSCYDDIVTEAETLFDKFNDVNNNVVIKVPINTAMDENDDNFTGVKAIKYLTDKGIPVNCTLVMSPNQALMAAKAGADYVSPFLGRIDDYIRTNMGLVRGEDYPKGTYFPHELVDTVRNQKLKKNIDDLERDNTIYTEKEVMDLYEWGNDDGILSGVDLVWSIKQIYANYGFDTKIIAASIRTERQVRQCAEIGAEIATIPFKVIKEMMKHYKTKEGMESFTKDVIPEYENIVEGK